MRAFVHYICPVTENDQLGTGRTAGTVTPEYKNLKNMQKWFLNKLPPGKYHVEVFTNWERCYGTADIDYVHEVK